MSEHTPNVDFAEIQKFSELAHHWWDETSEFAPLHRINPLRLDWIDRHAQIAGKNVLDIGCGGGILSESMAVRGACVTGIDLSEDALAVARLHLLETGREVSYLQISAEEHAAARPAFYDAVTCMEMLEHVPDPASIVRSAATLVKPGGQVFFSTLNRNRKAWLFAIVAAERILKLLPRGTHEYSRFLKPSELARFCRDVGLQVEEIIGLTYNPLTRVYALSSDTDVNYLIRTRRAG